MNARATRRPGSRGRRSSGRSFRQAKPKGGCGRKAAVFLLAALSVPALDASLLHLILRA